MPETKNRRWSHSGGVLFVLLAFILSAVVSHGCSQITKPVASGCIVQRSAFDMGSATLKMKTAKVDKCRRINLKTILQKEVKVPFAENTRNHLLSRDIRISGQEVVKTLQREALAYGPQTFAGVATAAFRLAENAPQFLEEIRVETGITIKLISQDEEAVLGYQAVLARSKDPAENIIVWDIGGNSMQIIMQTGRENHLIYQGDIASISFKNQIVEKVHGRSPGRYTSPNPIGRRNLAPVLEIARNAAAAVPEEIKKCLRQTGTIIIGIGGVHNQSVKKQLNSAGVYRQDDLVDVLHKRLDLTDAQIGGQYADTDVSNLILVLGFMQKLEIKEVHLLDVNLADGVLIDPAYW